MDHLMKLVTTALQWSYAKAQDDVSAKYLEAAAEQLTLQRDKIQVIDAQETKGQDESEKPEVPAEQQEQESDDKKQEKRGRNKRLPKETELPNPK